MNRKLKPYMVYSRGGGASEGAMLVFDFTVKEAKVTAWHSNTFIHDITDGDFLDLACDWLKKADYLFEEADQQKLMIGVPHVIECPTCCKDCEKWGFELNDQGYCESCADEYEDQNPELLK